MQTRFVTDDRFIIPAGFTIQTLFIITDRMYHTSPDG